ncbi:hypothetical protein HDK90DRAFT_546122 [Phyllosticta capitalensis]|uniref:Uncharacterized protein n=2 Tax=Phyllosticta capitalensis TaxID=121624 RepID=A0ABR1YYN7_9PEZI
MDVMDVSDGRDGRIFARQPRASSIADERQQPALCSSSASVLATIATAAGRWTYEQAVPSLGNERRRRRAGSFAWLCARLIAGNGRDCFAQRWTRCHVVPCCAYSMRFDGTSENVGWDVGKFQREQGRPSTNRSSDSTSTVLRVCTFPACASSRYNGQPTLTVHCRLVQVPKNPNGHVGFENSGASLRPCKTQQPARALVQYSPKDAGIGSAAEECSVFSLFPVPTSRLQRSDSAEPLPKRQAVVLFGSAMTRESDVDPHHASQRGILHRPVRRHAALSEPIGIRALASIRDASRAAGSQNEKFVFPTASPPFYHNPRRNHGSSELFASAAGDRNLSIGHTNEIGAWARHGAPGGGEAIEEWTGVYQNTSNHHVGSVRTMSASTGHSRPFEAWPDGHMPDMLDIGTSKPRFARADRQTTGVGQDEEAL